MEVESSELTKYASNSFLATKISFVNFIAQLCEECGANVQDVAKGMGLDKRIAPPFLNAGIGYGGSCFPKDVQALIKTADAYGVSSQLLRDVEAINDWQRDLFVRKVEAKLGDVRGKTFAVWGLAFKPDTDDMRSAPSIDVITLLLDRGATIRAYDPVAMEIARKVLPEEVTFCEDEEETLSGADALLVLTEWKHWTEWQPAQIAEKLSGNHVFDGRNAFGRKAVEEAGLEYEGIGT
jgi:UDPglucose 6-dehydrogenase